MIAATLTLLRGTPCHLCLHRTRTKAAMRAHLHVDHGAQGAGAYWEDR